MKPKRMADGLKGAVRDIPGFPKAGIVFKDITPILQSGPLMKQAMDALADRFRDDRPTKVIGAEARGFIFAPVVAYLLGAGFVPIRKPGKLPHKTRGISYDLEYGQDRLEIHEDAILRGERVLCLDDLLATGGTMKACCSLVEGLGGHVVGCGFLIELGFLPGRKALNGFDVFSVIHYENE